MRKMIQPGHWAGRLWAVCLCFGWLIAQTLCVRHCAQAQVSAGSPAGTSAHACCKRSQTVSKTTGTTASALGASVAGQQKGAETGPAHPTGATPACGMVKLGKTEKGAQLPEFVPTWVLWTWVEVDTENRTALEAPASAFDPFGSTRWDRPFVPAETLGLGLLSSGPPPA